MLLLIIRGVLLISFTAAAAGGDGSAQRNGSSVEDNSYSQHVTAGEFNTNYLKRFQFGFRCLLNK